MTRRRLVQIGIVLALIVGAAAGARAGWSQLRPREIGVPTARVQRGDVDTSITASGELKAMRMTPMMAPAVGGQLRLMTLLITGTPVKAGEVVMAFDPSDQENKLAEQRALLLEADLEIEKLKADAAAQIARDKVDLLTAQFDVKKAELDVTGNELLGAIKARQNELTLEESRRRLAQLEEDIKSHTTTNEAAMAVLVEKRAKAQLAMDQAQQTIAAMVVRSPIDGIVSVNPNRDGINFGFPGMVVPEYREGDNVSGGRAVAEVLDRSKIEILAKVPETERSNVATGQRALLTMDGLSGARVEAKVTNVGVIRGGGPIFRGIVEGPVRLVDVTLALAEPLATGRPGLTGQVRIASDPLKGVLYVPRQAIFDREGKPHVYVKVGGGFEARGVQVKTRTESAVVVEGVPEGSEIAIADPDRKPGQNVPAPGVQSPTSGTARTVARS